MTASAMLLGSLLLIWAALRLRARWVAWGAIAPIFLALGLLPVHGASDEPTLEIEAQGQAARYSVCGTTHHIRSAGGRASYAYPLNEQLTLTATGGADIVEHESLASTGLPDTRTEGYGLLRVGAFNRWASAQLGLGLMFTDVDRLRLTPMPTATLHLGPYDMVYVNAFFRDSYVDAAFAGGRLGVTAVVPVSTLQRWELGLGVTQYGVYTETFLRSKQGFGLGVLGARARAGQDPWQVSVGVSFRAPVRDY
ncbi:MAG: hypothetical protein H6741_25380 [Alphaproteobacteria bacterium]|nr:hypothetical protein [Alphaproteobacteria bacterium]